jgi:hypothetical protein
MYIGLHVKCPLFLSDFNESWIFSTEFDEYSNKNFMKIRTAAAEFFYEDRRTDGHDEAKCRFSQFYERAYQCDRK